MGLSRETGSRETKRPPYVIRSEKERGDDSASDRRSGGLSNMLIAHKEQKAGAATKGDTCPRVQTRIRRERRQEPRRALQAKQKELRKELLALS